MDEIGRKRGTLSEEIALFRKSAMARWERIIADDSFPEAHRLIARKLLDGLKRNPNPRVFYEGFVTQGDDLCIGDPQTAERLVKAGFTCAPLGRGWKFPVQEIEARIDEFRAILRESRDLGESPVGPPKPTSAP